MTLIRRLLLTLLLCGLPLHWAKGDALVLIHGYLGSAESWAEGGVTRELTRGGWRYGGELVATRNGVRVRGGGKGERLYYLLSLPSEAPIEVQMRYLMPMLKEVRRRHPEQTLSIAGHSLGGVLGRYAMVQSPDLDVDNLVTIASPHLGTSKAELALLAGSTPLSMMAPFVGGQTLNRSRGLYSQLVPEAPGTFLYWLNRQQHPDARYFSVLRGGSEGFSMGDMVVPEYSQDMNNVAALRGRAYTRRSRSDHALGAADGRGILLALNQPR